MRGVKNNLHTPHFIWRYLRRSNQSVRVFQRDDLAQRPAGVHINNPTSGVFRSDAGRAAAIQEQADERAGAPESHGNLKVLVDRLAELLHALGSVFPGHDQIDLFGDRIHHDGRTTGAARQGVRSEPQIVSAPAAVAQHQVATTLHPGGSSAAQSRTQIGGIPQNGRKQLDHAIDISNGGEAQVIDGTRAIGADRHTVVDGVVQAGHVATRAEVEEPAVDAEVGTQAAGLFLEVDHLNIAGVGFNDVKVHAVDGAVEIGVLLGPGNGNAAPHLGGRPGDRAPVHIGPVASAAGSQVHVIVGQLDAVPAGGGHKVDLGIGLVAAPGVDVAVILAGAGAVCVEPKAVVHGGLHDHAVPQRVDDPGLLRGAAVRPKGHVLIVLQAGDIVAVNIQTLVGGNIDNFIVCHDFELLSITLQVGFERVRKIRSISKMKCKLWGKTL